MSKLKKGYTLIEAMIAITIITITVSIPVRIISESILYGIITEEKLISSLLTQEKLEEIRKIRDDNIYNEVEWTNNIENDVPTTGEEMITINNIEYKRTTNISDLNSSKPGKYPFQGTEISFFTVEVETSPVFLRRNAVGFVSIKQSLTFYPWLLEI